MSETTRRAGDAVDPSRDGGLELHPVRIIGLPVAIAEAATAHNEALRREFQLIHEANADERAGVPSRLLALVAELRDRFAGFGDAQREQFLEAIAAGRDSIDLTYEVPATVADAVVHLGAMLDEADAFCLEGEALLTLASPPDAIAYRRWFLDEFARQIGGAAPRSWAEFRAAAAAADADRDPGLDPGADSTSDTRGFGGDLDDVTGGALPEGWSLSADDGTARLELAGDLDIESAPQLRSAFRQLRQTGATRLAIDARRVTFLDSVGMSVLITGHLRFTEDGTDYTLAVSEEMRRTLEVTGLASRLSIID